MNLGAAISVASDSSSARDEEGLPELLRVIVRTRNAAVGDERDETERGQATQCLPHRRSADVEALRDLFLAEDLPRLELAGDDLLLEHERDLVGLRAFERRHSRS